MPEHDLTNDVFIENATRLQADETPTAWSFKSDAVADKFEQHVREQLPWYDALSRYVCDLVVSFLPQRGVVYDIGASTGNITKLLCDTREAKGATFVSIEPSHQMTKNWAGTGELWTIDAETVDYSRKRPDVAVLFLTLMFMRPGEREQFLAKLFEAVVPGGAVILVDKGYLGVPAVATAAKTALLASKLRSGSPADAYVSKELSLRGEQRPTDQGAVLELARLHGFDGERIFQFGEFYGLALVKRAL